LRLIRVLPLIWHLTPLLLELLWKLAVHIILSLEELSVILLIILLLNVSLIWHLVDLLRRKLYALWKAHGILVKEGDIFLVRLPFRGFLLLWLMLCYLLLFLLGFLFFQVIYPILLLKFPSNQIVVNISRKIRDVNKKFSIEVNSSFAVLDYLL